MWEEGVVSNRSSYLLKFLEGLKEIIYVKWVVCWLASKCSLRAGWKLLFVPCIISFTEHLLSSLLPSSSRSLPLPSPVSLSGQSVRLSPLLPPPAHQSPYPALPTCTWPWLRYHWYWPHRAPLPVSKLWHHPEQRQAQQSPEAEVSSLRGLHGSEKSGCRGGGRGTTTAWSGAPWHER